MAKLSKIVASAALSVGLALPLAAGCGGAEDPIASPCPPGQRCQVNFTFLHTSDIHSRLFPYEQVITQVDATLGLGALNQVANVGGVARLSYLIGRERARADRVIHLDSGDCFQGAPIFNFYQGEPEMRAMTMLGTDAAVIGNHEFDYGGANAARQIQMWAGFPALAANYLFEEPAEGNTTGAFLGSVSRPFVVYNTGGIKVAVIGMANLSSLTSIFDQPNRLGINPLTTVEVAQFYVDLLRPHVDLVAMVTHLGLDVDQRMVRGTTGIDVVLGGHNHVVINPPQEVRDCSADPNNPGFIWEVDPNAKVDPGATPPDDPEPELQGPAGRYDPVHHPYKFKRPCSPRRVVITHSGAFAKYLGRLDTILSNDKDEIERAGVTETYDPNNGYEVLTSRYTAFPVDSTVPEDPLMLEMLQPYKRSLDVVADLDTLVGYSPQGSRRISASGGDSPLGNLVATAMWLRLGVQTDFSMTNSTGVRADLNPGPITLEQMYNIFPFDNSIAKMQLSGIEVRDLFDFVARRSAARGCTSQVQIAGARIRVNCTTCTSTTDIVCQNDVECAQVRGTCNLDEKKCVAAACADQIFIGHTARKCKADADCVEQGEPTRPGQCDFTRGIDEGLCLSPIRPTSRYELATSNYLAGGGSGFRMLQRNTTQFDTLIQQRDALIDYLRQGKPCGSEATAGTPEGLKACGTDADCGSPTLVCSCPGNVTDEGSRCTTSGACDPAVGRCVLAECRDQVAAYRRRVCADNPARDACQVSLGACEIAGRECQVLPCVDRAVGNFSDGRVEMVGR